MPQHRQSRGFTLIELLVVIAIIAILAAILFPVFARARENARKATCQSNLKQIGTACAMYRQDYDERSVRFGYTTTTGVDGQSVEVTPHYLLQPYVKNTNVFICPSGSKYNGYKDTGCAANGRSMFGYGMNVGRFNGARVCVSDGPTDSQIPDPAGTIYWFDTNSNCQAGGPWGNAIPANWGDTATVWADLRHMDGANYLFFDGHVKWLKTTQWRQWSAEED